jgi:flavin reductase (DIM6/NTAB) family NADH-FMN oxidoreductase RutF
LAGVTAVPRRVANVPRVAESLAAMECKVIDIVQFRNTAGEKVEGWLVLGEVVAVYIDKLLLKDASPILVAMSQGGELVHVSATGRFTR